jgi:hypothetical protein
MNSFSALSEITFGDEIEAMRLSDKSGQKISYVYRGMMKAHPNLQKFLEQVREHSGQDAVAILWRRIWYAIESERSMGSTATIDLLLQLPDMDDRVMRLPPPDCRKPLTHYLVELDCLVQSNQRS